MDETASMPLLGELIDLQGKLAETDDFDRLTLLSRMIEIITLLTGEKEPKEGTETKPDETQELKPDPQWEKDQKTLLMMIDRSHPKLDKPELADEVLRIYNDHKGVGERFELIVKAVDEWAAYVIELTKGI